MAAQETYIFAGGGTGGHLYPAIALAQELKNRRPHAEVHFVGTRRGIEHRVIPEHGFPLHLITVRGVARRLFLRNLVVPFVLLWSLAQCAVLMRRLRPAVVVGTGGYVSGPVLWMATVMRIPTLIQEQNSYPGATTRLLAPRVDRVHLSFEESKLYFKKTENLLVTGNPVRHFDMSGSPATARQAFHLDPERPTVLVFGGSQGARAINTALLDGVKELLQLSDAQIIWSAGNLDADLMERQTQSMRQRIWTHAFIRDMATAYRAADVVVARAGALTLAELTVCGLPSILIPLPTAAANHQMTNAQALQVKGAARVIPQNELTPEVLREHILQLLADDTTRQLMAEAARDAAFPQATEDIVDSIEHIARTLEE